MSVSNKSANKKGASPSSTSPEPKFRKTDDPIAVDAPPAACVETAGGEDAPILSDGSELDVDEEGQSSGALASTGIAQGSDAMDLVQSMFEEFKVDMQADMQKAMENRMRKMMNKLGERMASLEDRTSKIAREVRAVSETHKTQGEMLSQVLGELREMPEKGERGTPQASPSTAQAPKSPAPPSSTAQSSAAPDGGSRNSRRPDQMPEIVLLQFAEVELHKAMCGVEQAMRSRSTYSGAHPKVIKGRDFHTFLTVGFDRYEDAEAYTADMERANIVDRRGVPVQVIHKTKKDDRPPEVASRGKALSLCSRNPCRTSRCSNSRTRRRLRTRTPAIWQ